MTDSNDRVNAAILELFRIAEKRKMGYRLSEEEVAFVRTVVRRIMPIVNGLARQLREAFGSLENAERVISERSTAARRVREEQRNAAIDRLVEQERRRGIGHMMGLSHGRGPGSWMGRG